MNRPNIDGYYTHSQKQTDDAANGFARSVMGSMNETEKAAWSKFCDEHQKAAWSTCDDQTHGCHVCFTIWYPRYKRELNEAPQDSQV